MNPPVHILAGADQITTRAYATGGGKPQVIPDDHIFAGRMQGGATRIQVYGTRDYGSGYPGGGILRGTTSRGFPFYFWPVVWTNVFTLDAGDAYLHPTEYGLPDNTTRPGGPLVTLTYISRSSHGTTFRILTDRASAQALIPPLSACAPLVHLASSSPAPYLEHAVAPLPEQALQYFRASSAVLTLDGYNNSAALLPQEDSASTPNVLLPGGTDMQLLHCLNATIGSAMLLYDPPRGLDAESISLIVIAAVFAAVVGVLLLALTLPGKCRRDARRKSTLPCVINPIRPPPAVLKRRGVFERDEVASLAKNAEAFAGTDIELKGNMYR